MSSVRPRNAQASYPATLATRHAAMIAGYSLLLMAALAIFANFVVVEQMIDAADPAATLAGIAADATLFRLGIAAFVLVFLLDVVVAWALYVLVRHVNPELSLLAGWARLAYSAMLGVSLYHLLSLLQLATAPDAFGLEPRELHAQAAMAARAFDTVWDVALLLFGIHLLVLGAIALRHGFLPKLIGVLLLAAGLGYEIDGFAKLLLPTYADHEGIFLAIVAIPAVLGELSLAGWLVTKGAKLPDAAAADAGDAA